jgi:hypothetical protein
MMRSFPITVHLDQNLFDSLWRAHFDFFVFGSCGFRSFSSVSFSYDLGFFYNYPDRIHEILDTVPV